MVSIQLEKFSLPMFCFFRMECRRWAMRRVVVPVLFPDFSRLRLFFCMDCWVDGQGLAMRICRDAGEFLSGSVCHLDVC